MSEEALAAVLIEIRTGFARIEQSHVNLQKRLYGNGQPGDIDKLYAAIERRREDAIAIRSDLDGAKNWSRGVAATIGALWTGLELWWHGIRNG